MSSTAPQDLAILPGRHTAAGRPGGFFAHHGLWSPGVRLFRRLGFRAKALTVTAAFLVPVALLSWNYLRDKAAAIEFSVKEQQGVVYLRELLPLVQLGQTYRLHALQAQAKGEVLPEVAQARQARDTQMLRLEAVEQTLGTELGTARAIAAVKAAAEAATQAGPDQTFGAHSAYIDAVLALVAQAADGSNLTLDPEIDTFYLMDARLNTLPLLTEAAARLRGTSAAVAATGAPASAEMQSRISASAAVTDLFEERVDTALDKVYGLRADYKPDFKSDTLVPQMRQFRELALSGKADSGALIQAGNTVVDSLFTLQGRMIERLDELLAARVAALNQQRTYTALAVSISLLLGAYLFYSFYLVTQGGLNAIRRHLAAMQGGDLRIDPRPWGADEAAQLMLSLGQMQEALRSIVARVRGSSQSIVVASGQIASASQDLSSRTEQTASSLEQSASSMEEISSTVRHTADSVQEAAQVASGNAQSAARGGTVIAAVVSTMQEINASSRKIGDIIGTIDSIAFQTNILALNAAVEAARAGEQGRGFAVVASEVRSLAQRSAQAAREIKGLITSSVEQVNSGAQVVQGAGDTMQEMVGNARRMNDLLSQISTAASEQSTGVSLVGTTVHELDRMTQQNATLVEQTAAAASALRDQAVGPGR